MTDALLSRGVISGGWYSVLTGVAMLFVAWVLGSVADDDPAALVVALGLVVLGAWQLERGVRSELRQRGTG